MAEFFTPCTVLGDGSKANPRRATMFPRLDMQMHMIDAGLVCMKSDGTFSPLAPESHQESLYLDLGGQIGVKLVTVPDSVLELFLGDNPYVAMWPSGQTIAELKSVLAQTADDLLVEFSPKLPTRGGRSGGKTKMADSVRDLIAGASDSRGGSHFSGVRQWYVDRHDGNGIEGLPGAVLDAQGLIRPAQFRALLNYMNNAPRSSAGNWVHRAHLLAASGTLAAEL